MHVHRFLTVAAPLLLATSVPRAAFAQVHWDAGAQVGVVRRVFTGGQGDGGFGPMGTVQGHVALFPLIRVGAYASYDWAPASNTDERAAGRHVFGGGLRLKVGSPWPRGAWHAWAFLGAGYVGVHAPRYRRAASSADGPVEVAVPAGGGGHVEIPVGIGIGYRFWRPWELTLEVGSRFGFAFTGSIYDASGRAFVPGAGHAALVGHDTVAPFAVVGVSLGE